MYCPSCRAVIDPASGTCSRCGEGANPEELSSVDVSEIQPSAGHMGRAFAGLLDLIPLLLLAAGLTYLKLRVGIGARGLAVGSMLPAAALLLLRDSLRGLSPGKAIMGIRAVRHDSGQPAGVPDSILRNLPLLPLAVAPLSPKFGALLAVAVLAIHSALILILGRGLTDFVGSTRVVKGE